MSAGGLCPKAGPLSHVSASRIEVTAVKVVVTSAQKNAAAAMVRRWEMTGRPVRESVRKIAEAKQCASR